MLHKSMEFIPIGTTTTSLCPRVQHHHDYILSTMQWMMLLMLHTNLHIDDPNSPYAHLGNSDRIIFSRLLCPFPPTTPPWTYDRHADIKPVNRPLLLLCLSVRATRAIYILGAHLMMMVPIPNHAAAPRRVATARHSSTTLCLFIGLLCSVCWYNKFSISP